MNVTEGDLVQRYWKRVGGQLIEEFKAVEGGENNGRRHIDGVIIKNKETERLGSYMTAPLEGEDVIVVQCKKRRLGMYLMGQAYFSMHLIERYNPSSVKSVALCPGTDGVLGPIFESLPNCEVVEMDF
jgi:hypothetical protein